MDIEETYIKLSDLRRLLGYVENGSDEVVKLFQDDATKDYIIRVGNQTYFSRSFNQVLLAAIADQLEE